MPGGSDRPGWRTDCSSGPIVRTVHVTAVMVASVSLLAAGCGHTLVWPPSPAEVARINQDAADENGWLRVEYVEPIPRAQRVEPVAIEAVAATHVVFRTKTGEPRLVGIDAFKGVTIKDRVLGVGIWGGGLTAAMTALVLAYWHEGHTFDRYPGNCFGCGDPEFFAVMVGGAALVGVILGYALGIRRTYTFTGRP